MVALPIPDLPTGIMRGRFHPADGQLYTCGLYAWAGNRQHPGGFFRVRRTDRPLTIPVGLHAEPGRLDIEFAVPLDEVAATELGHWTIRAWDLERTKKYGSQHLNERQLPVTAATVSVPANGLPTSSARLSFQAVRRSRAVTVAWRVSEPASE
jgi:hypothetical protein